MVGCFIGVVVMCVVVLGLLFVVYVVFVVGFIVIGVMM